MQNQTPQVQAQAITVPKIAYCQVTSAEQSKNALMNILSVKPFVDHCVLVYDEMPENVKQQLEGVGAILIQAQFNNNFTEFRKHYIAKCRELRVDYVLFSDTDESFDTTFLSSLKSILMMNPQFNGFELYCHYDIPNKEVMDGNEISREAPGGLDESTNWWKICLIRLEADMYYTGNGVYKNTHEYIVSSDWRIVKLPKKFFFVQKKTAEQIWRNSARAIIICGGGLGVGRENKVYSQLLPILEELNIAGWTEFEKYCVAGNIDSRIKQIFIAHRNDSMFLYDSENRSLFKWYFNYLHPEENVEGLKSDFKTADYADGIRDYVRRTYFEILGRDADVVGLDNYTKLIKEDRMDFHRLAAEFKTSDEYVTNYVNTSFFEMFGRGTSGAEMSVWKKAIQDGIVTDLPKLLKQMLTFTNIRVGYCQMTHKGDLEETIKNVVEAKNYVDACIVVYDDTLSNEDITRLVDAGATARYYRWYDNFPRQRNNYLMESRYLGLNWVIVSDPDEHFDKHFLEDCKKIITQGAGMGANMIQINAHDVFTDSEQGQDLDPPSENVSDYYKNLCFAVGPDVAYVGIGTTQNLHETMTGNFRGFNLSKEYFYRHVRSHKRVWEHAGRNMFIAGGGDNLGDKNPTYNELKALTNMLDIHTWEKFKKYMADGNIDPALKGYLISHRGDFGHPWDAEVREMFKWYFFILHPEENVDHLDVPPEPERKMDETQQFVKDSYVKILGREPDYAGFEYYTNEIRQGRLPKEVLHQTLMASEEYKRRVMVAPPININP